MIDPTEAWRTAYQHPTPWEQSFPPLSLPDMFAASARRAPNAPLIDFMGRKYSFAEVENGICRVACGLAAMGVGKGDRVGLFLPNVPHYVAAYYGALRLGAVLVNFSPLYTVAELAAQIEDSGTRILFTLSAQALLPQALEVMELTRARPADRRLDRGRAAAGQVGAVPHVPQGRDRRAAARLARHLLLAADRQ